MEKIISMIEQYNLVYDALGSSQITMRCFKKHLLPLYAKQISVLNSVQTTSTDGYDINSVVVDIPKFLVPQLLTHQILKFNGASSRAIPTKTVINDIPIYMPPVLFKNCVGMAGKTLISKNDYEVALLTLQNCYTSAINATQKLAEISVHKQHIRVLEAFLMTRYVITGTEWTNFFTLRPNMEAQPEFIALALLMDNSTPIIRHSNLHLPFFNSSEFTEEQNKIINIALAAKVSYRKQDAAIDYEALKLTYKKLIDGKHLSPFSHVANAYDGVSIGFNGCKSERARLFGDAFSSLDSAVKHNAISSMVNTLTM